MSPPMQLEWADSEVAVAWRRDAADPDAAGATELTLRLSAAQVRRDDDTVPGGFVRGHMRAVEVVFTGRGMPVPRGEHVGRLAQGRVEVDGAWRGVVPLPFVLHGPLAVELDFANGARLAFTAERLAVLLPERPVFTESMAC